MNIGNPDPTQAPQRRITIKETSEVTCDLCKNNTFTDAMFMRRVSPLASSTGKPEYIPVPQAVVCTKCGHCNIEFVPIDLRSNKIVT
jgi:hypothetical protein